VHTIGEEGDELLAAFTLRALSISSVNAPTSSSAAYYDRVPETVDPFAASAIDPFSGAAPAAFDDPFGASSAGDSFASSSRSSMIGKAPPRPAPPKNRASTPSGGDPFSGAGADSGGGFADFSRAFS